MNLLKGIDENSTSGDNEEEEEKGEDTGERTESNVSPLIEELNIEEQEV